MTALVETMTVTVRLVPNVEYELDASNARTGRWRRRQFYGLVGDRRVPSERKECEWREGVPR